MSANLGNSAVATGLEKVSLYSNPKDWQWKECSNFHTIALISCASKAHECVLSHVWLVVITWTVAHQAPPVHGIFWARILGWVAISFSKGSWPSNWNPRLSHLLHWQADSLPTVPPGKPWNPLVPTHICFGYPFLRLPAHGPILTPSFSKSGPPATMSMCGGPALTGLIDSVGSQSTKCLFSALSPRNLEFWA